MHKAIANKLWVMSAKWLQIGFEPKPRAGFYMALLKSARGSALWGLHASEWIFS